MPDVQQQRARLALVQVLLEVLRREAEREAGRSSPATGSEPGSTGRRGRSRRCPRLVQLGGAGNLAGPQHAGRDRVAEVLAAPVDRRVVEVDVGGVHDVTREDSCAAPRCASRRPDSRRPSSRRSRRRRRPCPWRPPRAPTGMRRNCAPAVPHVLGAVEVEHVAPRPARPPPAARAGRRCRSRRHHW